jgi:hypothetical protein
MVPGTYSDEEGLINCKGCQPGSFSKFSPNGVFQCACLCLRLAHAVPLRCALVAIEVACRFSVFPHSVDIRFTLVCMRRRRAMREWHGAIQLGPGQLRKPSFDSPFVAR